MSFSTARLALGASLGLFVSLALLAGAFDGGAASAGEPSGAAADSPTEGAGETGRASAESLPGLRHGERAIMAAMDEPVSVDFKEMPLLGVVDQLRRVGKVNMHIDRRALEDVGIGTDTPITFVAGDLPLRAVLELMLDELDLTWDIRQGVLVVTTREEAENRLTTKVYSVRDLLIEAADQQYPGGLPGVPVRTSPHRFPYSDSHGFDSRWSGGGMGMGGMGGGMGSGMGSGTGDGSAGGAGGGLFRIDDRQPMAPAAKARPQSGSALGRPGFTTLHQFDGLAYPPGVDTLLHGQVTNRDALRELIVTVIQPTTWDEVGGPGSIVIFGSQMIVSQTLDVHLEIAEFLESLRQKRRERATLAVDARWLLLDSDELDALRAGAANRPGTIPEGMAVDRAALERLTRTAPGLRGRVACLDGQHVYLAAGARRTVIHGAIPVVGSGVGYQPVVAVPNLGALLGVRPLLVPETQTARVHLEGTVTRWDEPGPPVRIQTVSPPTPAGSGEHPEPAQPASSSSVEVDRANIPAQQLATTLTVPLKTPVLVGGLTYLPSPNEEEGQPGADLPQLYLVIEVDRSEAPAD